MYRPSISFCIISNGMRPNALDESIKSIRKLEIPDYEILVSGEPPSGLLGVTTVSAVEAAREGRLGEMRNKITCLASKDIIVVCDDDILFQNDFYSGICSFGSDFQVLCVRILNPDGSRYWDWAVVDAPTGHHLIDYSESSPYVYVTGGLCVMKREVSDIVKWPDDNGFYEGEDVNFSARLKNAGISIKMNSNSTVIHNDPRMTQIGAKIIKNDMPYHWQLHKSGCKLLGSNPGATNKFSVTKDFIVEVPSHLFNEDLIFSSILSLNFPVSEFKNNQRVEVFLNDKILGEFHFDEINSYQKITITIPKSILPSVISMKSDFQIPQFWIENTISKTFSSFTVNNLTLETATGRKIQNYFPEFKQEIKNIEKSLNSRSIISQKGVALLWPLAIGNPYTRVIRSLANSIAESCPEVGIRGNFVEYSCIKNIKESSEESKYWLDLIQRNTNNKIQLELLSTSYAKDRLSSSTIKNRFEIESIKGVLLEDFSSISFQDGLFGFKVSDDKIGDRFLPLSLDLVKLSKETISIPRSCPENLLITIEIDSYNLDTFAVTLAAILKQYNISNIDLVLFEREKTSENAVPISLEALKAVCNAINFDINNLPYVSCFNEFLTDHELSSVYKSSDLVVLCAEKSNFANCILPLALSAPILIVGDAKDEQILNSEYLIDCYRMSGDFKIDINRLYAIIENKIKNLKFQKENSVRISNNIINNYDSKIIAPYWVSFLNSL